MTRATDCIFCKIVAVEIPAAVVFENDSIFAFLDVGPLAEGHLLVIPRDHYANLVELPSSLCAQIGSLIPKLGRVLLDVTAAEGFNLLANQGRVAGQVVPHVHFHLIPRVADDQLGYRWNAGEYPPGRSEELAAAYQAALAEHED
ncbi:MAG: HIT family protein [Phycisphaerales bacterium]|nr:MAG: HIT family protein [Phycisphaerales bacterium]